MRETLFFILYILFPLLFFAQYQPFAKVNATWHYNIYYGGPSISYIKIHAEKDTIINGKNCSKLIRKTYSYDLINLTYSDYTLDTNYMTKDGGKVLLFRIDTFLTVYDFSLNIGDSLVIPGSVYHPNVDSTGCYFVTGKGDTIINGRSFKYIDVYSPIHYTFQDGYDWGYNTRILEDIGPLSTDLYPNQQYYQIPPGFISGNGIRCFSDSTFSWQIVTCDSLVGIDEISQQTHVVYPNPATNQITIESTAKPDSPILLYNEAGQLLLRKDSPEQIEIIDLSCFNSGLMYLVIGSEVQTIIKQ
ncbi:MAG: T9SS type A sorting domain-containing protein [Bacteroidales bacterium]|nr:T9SS type A sorting domain-containing protein [Bacteroidales bacterium]